MDNEEPDIRELTRGLVRADENAFVEFHRFYFSRLHHFLLGVARGNEDEAAEAVQQTMINVARHPRYFDDPESLWRWLKAVARNAARDRGRRQSRYGAMLQRFARINSEQHDDDDLAQTMTACLGELAEADRSLLQAKYFDRRTLREIGTEAGMTERAVEGRLSRIREKLRRAILAKLMKR